MPVSTGPTPLYHSISEADRYLYRCWLRDVRRMQPASIRTYSVQIHSIATMFGGAVPSDVSILDAVLTEYRGSRQYARSLKQYLRTYLEFLHETRGIAYHDGRYDG
jgi:hypothetical protein